MIAIDKLPHPPASDSYERVAIPMTSHDRQRVRRKLTAPDGCEFALSLPTGSVLPVNHALHLQGNTLYVIAAAPEDVLLVRPRSLQEAAYIGHLIGNLHRDIDIQDEGILALWDTPLEQRLIKAGLDYERCQRPFSGKPPGEHSH